ncbi:GNAT family N-acetyltransferase [Oceanobacter mangrovi]|uniref:GNAT family N-acetyltransferase n=1 Tax=Oceanobacter mangrovi TaxID=2862510 RepID=UPI001C8DFBA9|nr:GNAT family N-acetyltransferase [Oceanobacter mangrovi]
MAIVKLVAKNRLSAAHLAYLNNRLQRPEHQNDSGPLKVWNIYCHDLYAVILVKEDIPIGIVEASGRPTCTPGWWIDSQYRGQGYGNYLVDELAEFLLVDDVENIGSIPVTGQCASQSGKLAERLKHSFEELKHLRLAGV